MKNHLLMGKESIYENTTGYTKHTGISLVQYYRLFNILDMMLQSGMCFFSTLGFGALGASYAEDKVTGALIGGGVGLILGILSLPNLSDS